VWFQQRAGRITASRIRAAAHTDPTQPSPSLIKSIWYPESHQFETHATTLGCEHEQTARNAHVAMAEKIHTGLSVSPNGLHGNTHRLSAYGSAT